MSRPPQWSKKTFFYPIGNSSAVSLTRDLPPGLPADVLLLGCGDTRNILYTVFCDFAAPRKFDFTCCDLEPATIARNIIQLTLILDDTDPNTLWNIYYHMKIDQSSLSLLTTQCRKLVRMAKSLETWDTSPYGEFLKFSTASTLEDVRALWTSYVETASLKGPEKRQLQEKFATESEKCFKEYPDNPLILRAIAPIVLPLVELMKNTHQPFWTTGTMFTSGDPRARSSTHLNPTFVHSLMGTDFNVHYATSPLVPFHLAPAFAKTTPSVKRLVSFAQSQASKWAEAFRKKKGSVIVRFHSGDALHFCSALAYRLRTGQHDTPIHLTEWRATPISLNHRQYQADGTAPFQFNVIDSSNLSDHLGMLNILITATSILQNSPTSFIYTDTFLSPRDGDIAAQIFGDIPTLSILLGLVPPSYMSNFSSHSSVHEIAANELLGVSQSHQRVDWRRASYAPLSGRSCGSLTMTSDDMTSLLFALYTKIFRRRIRHNTFMNYSHQSFAMLISQFVGRVITDWDAVIAGLLRAVGATSVEYQSLVVQLYSQGLYRPPNGAMTRILLQVPRDNLRRLEDLPLETMGSPGVACAIQSGGLTHVFDAIQLTFGDLVDNNAGCKVDPKSWHGESDLIVIFSVPSILIDADAVVHFKVQKDSANLLILGMLLGPGLIIFSSKTTNPAQVKLIPDIVPPTKTFRVLLNREDSIMFKAKEGATNELIYRVHVEDKAQKLVLAKKEVGVSAQQSLMNGMSLSFGGFEETVHFPFPINGLKPVVRVARASHYIEVVVLVALPHTEVVANPSFNIFPLYPIPRPFDQTTYNTHYVNLDSLPVLDPLSHSPEQWFNFHSKLAFGDSEATRLGMPEKDRDILTNVKATIQFILHETINNPQTKVWGLNDDSNGGLHTIFFIHKLRFDVSAHTLVADAYVLPAEKSLMPKISLFLQEVLNEMKMVNASGAEYRAWKELLPVLTERCRTWEHRADCPYRPRGCPVSYKGYESPLCGCGRGRVSYDFLKECKLAPYLTRIALSPLFVTPFFGDVGGVLKGPGATHTEALEVICSAPSCKSAGSLVCSRCKAARYCSKTCQKEDWKRHKNTC